MRALPGFVPGHRAPLLPVFQLHRPQIVFGPEANDAVIGADPVPAERVLVERVLSVNSAQFTRVRAASRRVPQEPSGARP